MKKAFFAFILITMAMSAWGVYNYFDRFHRARNSNAPRPMLLVYTHSSFMNPYGPGPEIASEFEKVCLCEVRYIDSGGGELLIQKLKLAQNVDVVLGLDQISLKRLATQIKMRDLKTPPRAWRPIIKENIYRHFVPYDWSPITLIVKNDSGPEASDIASLLRGLPDKSLSLQDPRHSTLGLQMLYWLFVEAGGDLEKLSELQQLLSQKTFKLSPDWSAAYGLFKRGGSEYVLSYMTSPIYHRKAENDKSYSGFKVKAGHPLHIEYAAVPDICRSCGLAKRFVEFLTEDKTQRILFEKNYMLPVVTGALDQKEAERVPEVKALGPENLDSFVDQRDEILERWKKAFL